MSEIPSSSPEIERSGSDEARVVVTLTNKYGLHARPAHLFVQTANSYAADLQVQRRGDGEPVDGKAILGVMMLAAEQGTELELMAKGPDSFEMLRAMIELVAANFGEE